jgi:hypothetical protein
MDELFHSLHDDIVPKGKDSEKKDIVNNMPCSRAEARKVIREVGFDYIVIDACPCDETLYYGATNGDLQKCPKRCTTSPLDHDYRLYSRAQSTRDLCNGRVITEVLTGG